MDVATSLFDSAVYVGFLGRGAYGTVKGYELPDGSSVAIKEIISANNGVDSSTVIELHCLSVLKGKPRILELLAVKSTPERLSIMLVQHTGSMRQFVEIINPQDILSVFPDVYEQLLEGLLYIRAAGIIHRDIKFDNILMEFNFDPEDTEYRLIGQVSCYYADFGLAFQTNCKNSSEAKFDRLYTPGYRAPELLAKREYSYKADVWALGIVLVKYLVENFSVLPTEEQIENALAGVEEIDEDELFTVQSEIELNNIMSLGNDKGEYIELHPLLGNLINERYIEEMQAMLCFDPNVRNRVTDFRDTPKSAPRTVYQPPRGNIKSSRISLSAFYNSVSWILQIVSKLDARVSVAVNSIDILERYLANYDVSNREMKQLLIACVLISSKMTDTVYVDLDSFEVDRDTLVDTEKRVMEKMNYISTSCELGEYLVAVESLAKPLLSLSRMYKTFRAQSIYSGALAYKNLSAEILRYR